MQNSFFVHQLGFCAQTLSKCRIRRDKGVFVYILTPFTVTSTPQENYQKRYKKSIFEYICMLMPSAGRTKQRGGPHAARGPPVGDPCTKVLYDHSNKILQLPYLYKRNKNALMMSSSHFSISIMDCHNKHTVITDYDKHKGGVDTFDENCEEFSCLRKTNLWSMVVNYNLISVATNNAFIAMRGSGKCDRKTDFLKQLSFQLAQSYLSNRKLRAETKVLAEKMGFIDAASNAINRTVKGIKRGRCYKCGKNTRLACLVCHRRVCPQHRKMPKNTYCLEC